MGSRRPWVVRTGEAPKTIVIAVNEYAANDT